MPIETIRQLVLDRVTADYGSIWIPSVLEGWEKCNTLRNSVEKIVISESGTFCQINARNRMIDFLFSVCPYESLPMERCSLQIHVYQPTEGSTYEKMSVNPSDPGEEFTAGTMSELPSKELEGLWESLFYADEVKSRLLNYIYATVGFSDANVDCA